jgi:hypothetical protein
VARAGTVADIGGPFSVEEAIQGTYWDLDPESHNSLGPPQSRWPPGTEVWRITLVGPNGRESIVLSMHGDLIGAVTQGN